MSKQMKDIVVVEKRGQSFEGGKVVKYQNHHLTSQQRPSILKGLNLMTGWGVFRSFFFLFIGGISYDIIITPTEYTFIQILS